MKSETVKSTRHEENVNSFDENHLTILKLNGCGTVSPHLHSLLPLDGEVERMKTQAVKEEYMLASLLSILQCTGMAILIRKKPKKLSSIFRPSTFPTAIPFQYK